MKTLREMAFHCPGSRNRPKQAMVSYRTMQLGRAALCCHVISRSCMKRAADEIEHVATFNLRKLAKKNSKLSCAFISILVLLKVYWH